MAEDELVMVGSADGWMVLLATGELTGLPSESGGE